MRFDDIMISFDITISSLIDKKKEFDIFDRILAILYIKDLTKMNKLSKRAIY